LRPLESFSKRVKLIGLPERTSWQLSTGVGLDWGVGLEPGGSVGDGKAVTALVTVGDAMGVVPSEYVTVVPIAK